MKPQLRPLLRHEKEASLKSGENSHWYRTPRCCCYISFLHASTSCSHPQRPETPCTMPFIQFYSDAPKLPHLNDRIHIPNNTFRTIAISNTTTAAIVLSIHTGTPSFERNCTCACVCRCGGGNAVAVVTLAGVVVCTSIG